MSLPGLRRRLFAAILRELGARALAWLSVSLIALCAGTAVQAAFKLGPALALALAMAMASALPVVLLWPLPERLLARGLRALDSDSVFEAYLEAPPGPARELLRALAERRSGALPRAAGRRPLPPRLVALIAVAAASFAALQTTSLIVSRKPILLYRGDDEARTAARSEEGSFDEAEDRRYAFEGTRGIGEGARGRAGDEEGEGLGEVGAVGEGGAESEPFLASRRRAEDPAGLELPGEEGDGARGSPAGAARGEGRAEAETAGRRNEVGGAEGQAADANALGRGRGYENTGSTLAPSPIVDYRARFFEAYARRTGKRFAASGEQSLADLPALQRRYYRSFSLSVEFGPVEDAYETALKRRWRELRSSLP